jgi:hypothetical protein
MNKFPSKEQVECVRKNYPQGTRLELISMEDPYATLEAGDRCTVRGVDDAGQLMVTWDTGSQLSLIPDVDNFRKLTRRELIVEDVNKVRFHPKAPNMFDSRAVFELAIELECAYAPDFIFRHTDLWGAFVLTGEMPESIDTEEVL